MSISFSNSLHEVFQQEMEHLDNQSTSFSTIEVLLKDINQHIPIILIKEDAFTINCFVRGYHTYIDLLAPKTYSRNEV